MAVKKESKTVKETKATKVAKSEKVEVKKARGTQDTGGTSAYSVAVYSLVGKETTVKLDLPKEIFGASINKKLLAQALRVYLNNQKSHHGHTKTRGEVQGSTRKIFKQKGTGRARHGSIMAPIFVGGGIALGPRKRKVVLDLPKKMKKAALISALSQKMADKKIYGVEGLAKISGKTKDVAKMVSGIRYQVSGEDKKNKNLSILVLSNGKEEMAVRAIKNIKGVDILPASQINAFEVVAHQSLLLGKEAVEVLQTRFKKEGVA